MPPNGDAAQSRSSKIHLQVQYARRVLERRDWNVSKLIGEDVADQGNTTEIARPTAPPDSAANARAGCRIKLLPDRASAGWRDAANAPGRFSATSFLTKASPNEAEFSATITKAPGISTVVKDLPGPRDPAGASFSRKPRQHAIRDPSPPASGGRARRGILGPGSRA